MFAGFIRVIARVIRKLIKRLLLQFVYIDLQALALSKLNGVFGYLGLCRVDDASVPTLQHGLVHVL